MRWSVLCSARATHGNDFRGASIKVPHGAEFVPGLKDALATAR
jgi:hypothetical protein